MIWAACTATYREPPVPCVSTVLHGRSDTAAIPALPGATDDTERTRRRQRLTRTTSPPGAVGGGIAGARLDPRAFLRHDSVGCSDRHDGLAAAPPAAAARARPPHAGRAADPADRVVGGGAASRAGQCGAGPRGAQLLRAGAVGRCRQSDALFPRRLQCAARLDHVAARPLRAGQLRHAAAAVVGGAGDRRAVHGRSGARPRPEHAAMAAQRRGHDVLGVFSDPRR